MDLKKESARFAFTLIQDNSSIGLGDGSSIRLLAGFLKEGIQQGMKVNLYTSSLTTKAILQDAGLTIHDISIVDRLDQYFDGCEQVDHQLNALKSGAGIHTYEKLLASMAEKFTILADESKYVSEFDASFPLVLEVLPQATRFIMKELKKYWPEVSQSIRMNPETAGSVITRNGNDLIDCRFLRWPQPAEVQIQSKKITGVVEISLFYQIAGSAIIAGESGVRQIFSQI